MRIRYWASRPLARHVASSLFGGIVGQLLLIGSGIFLARLLGATNRGYLALLTLWPTGLEQLGALGLTFATAYFIARDPLQTRPLARLAFRSWFRQSVPLILVQCAMLAIYFSHREAYVRPAAVMSLVIIPTTLAVDYSLSILQGLRAFLQFNVVRNLLGGTACLVAVAATLVGLRDFTAIFALLMAGYIVSAAIAGLITWRAVRKWPQSALTTSAADVRKFGRRAFIGSLYPFEAFRFDQLIVSVIFPAASLGLFVVAQAFTNLPRFFTQSLGIVAYPYIASLSDRAYQRKTLVRFVLVGTLLTVSAVLVLEILMGWLVPFLFGSQFVGSVLLARILLPGALFFALRRILSEGLKGAGHPTLGTIAEIASWVAMVPLTAVLVPTLGLPGVAWAADGAGLVSLLTLLYLDWAGPKLMVGQGIPELQDGAASNMQ